MIDTENIVDLQREISSSTPQSHGGFGNISDLFGTVEDRGLASEIWISNRVDGAFGSGTSEDPFNGNPEATFQARLDAAPAGAFIHIVPGIYPAYVLTITKSVQIVGPRGAIFTQATGANKPIFNVSGVLTQFTIGGVSLSHGTTFRGEDNVRAIAVTAATDKIRLLDIYSSDFNNTILVDFTLNQLEVFDSEFVYTYGRAGISNPSPYQHPCASICGNPIKRLIVRNNIFNGLLDPTFTGVSGSPPSLQRVAADNFVQTGEHEYVDVDDNTIINHGIEAIYIARATVVGNYSYSITGNHTLAAIGVAGAYAPGVALLNSRAVVSGNTFSGTPLGVNVHFNSYDEIENVVNIDDNEYDRVLKAVDATNVSSRSTFVGGTVHNSSEPCRTVYGQLADDVHGCVPTEFYGVVTNRGNVGGIEFVADEPIWDAQTTLSSRASNVFTVASPVGITVGGVLVSYAGSSVSYFPVESISGSDITVNAGFASANPGVTTGTLYFAKTAANFTDTGAIVVRSGGNINADNNVITGYHRDLVQVSSGTITTTNHITHGCRIVQPASAAFIHNVVTLASLNGFDLTTLQNNWSGPGYKVLRFNNTDGGSNVKIADWVWNVGSFELRLMNDDLTVKHEPIIVAPDGTMSLSASTFPAGGIKITNDTLPAPGAGNNGKIWFDGAHWYAGASSIWNQLDILSSQTNLWTSSGFIVNRFTVPDAGSNLKIIETVVQTGTWQLRMLNDDLTVKGTPLLVNSDAQTVSVTKLESGDYRQNASSYHNFGLTSGASGYGLRDNGGVPEVKISGGDWSPIVPASALSLVAFSGDAGDLSGLAFNAISGQATPAQIDWTTTAVTEAATITLANGDRKKMVATGTLTTIAFSGGSDATKTRKLDLDVSGGPYTLTIPTCRRLGEVGSVSSITLQNGYHEFSWEYIGTEYVMADTVTEVIGEYVSASVVQGSATALTTATPKTVTSISLTAGDWDVTAIGSLTGASTGTEFDVAIGTTTNSFTGTVLGDTRCQTPTVSLTGADATLMIPAVRVNISATTIYYLIVQETFTIGSPAAYGRISARRVR